LRAKLSAFLDRNRKVAPDANTSTATKKATATGTPSPKTPVKPMNLEELDVEELRGRVLASSPDLDIADWDAAKMISFIDEKNLKFWGKKPYEVWRTRYLKLQVVRRGLVLPPDEDDRDALVAILNYADWKQEFT
jgi:hypothetical protein